MHPRKRLVNRIVLTKKNRHIYLLVPAFTFLNIIATLLKMRSQ